MFTNLYECRTFFMARLQTQKVDEQETDSMFILFITELEILANAIKQDEKKGE